MIRKIVGRILDNSSRIAAGKAADSLALGMLNDVDIGIDFMPWTKAAMRPSTIVHILNEIFINERRSIIEFGSGISTLYLAWAAKKTEARVLSIEENEGWSEKIRDLLKRKQLDEFCDVRSVKRRDVSMHGYKSHWYDFDLVKEIIEHKTFDLMIVDGPTAFQKGQADARRPAVDALRANLAENYAIFLDDAMRAGEKRILAAWEASLGLKASLEPVAGGHAFLGSGDRYYSGL
ncbi:MAG: hypothetical protein ACR2P3_06020 [Geminicoccaceae bacterium]